MIGCGRLFGGSVSPLENEAGGAAGGAKARGDEDVGGCERAGVYGAGGSEGAGNKKFFVSFVSSARRRWGGDSLGIKS